MTSSENNQMREHGKAAKPATASGDQKQPVEEPVTPAKTSEEERQQPKS